MLLDNNLPEGFWKKCAFKNFAKITEKHLCQGLFLNKVSGSGSATLLQIHSSIGAFLYILRNFQKHLFWLRL